MRILVSACIVAVGCALQPPHAKASSANELVESCNAVEQSAQSAPGDTVDISPEGLPCWYYMSAVQNMSALVDSKNERLLALCPPAESTTLDFVRAFLRSAERKNETDVNNPAVLVLPRHILVTDRQPHNDLAQIPASSSLRQRKRGALSGCYPPAKTMIQFDELRAPRTVGGSSFIASRRNRREFLACDAQTAR